MHDTQTEHDLIKRAGRGDAAYRQALISGLALRRWDGTNGSLRPLLDAAGLPGAVEDHGDGSVTAPSGAPVPAGIRNGSS